MTHGIKILGTFKINVSYKAALAFKGLNLGTNMFLSSYALFCEEEKKPETQKNILHFKKLLIVWANKVIVPKFLKDI